MYFFYNNNDNNNSDKMFVVNIYIYTNNQYCPFDKMIAAVYIKYNKLI